MPLKESVEGAEGGAAGSGAARGGSRGGGGVAGGSLGGSMGPARAATAVAAVPHMMSTEQRMEHEAGLAAGAERGRLAREQREGEERAQAWQAQLALQWQQQQQQQQQQQLQLQQYEGWNQQPVHIAYLGKGPAPVGQEEVVEDKHDENDGFIVVDAKSKNKIKKTTCLVSALHACVSTTNSNNLPLLAKFPRPLRCSFGHVRRI